MKKIPIVETGTGNYNLYRIPGIVVTAKGTVLSYFEERLGTNDWSARNIGIKRSIDMGDTWSECSHIIEENTDETINNPVMIACKNGIVHLFWQINYRRGFHQTSYDDGLTFSRPKEITDLLLPWRKDYKWEKFAFGPCHGIETKNGRLIIPVWLCDAPGDAHSPSVVSTLSSDDGAVSWKCGEIIESNGELINPSETIATQLSDARILLNIRHSGTVRYRAFSISNDGEKGFSKPRFDYSLPDPVCCAGLVRAQSGKIFFSNCANKSADGKSAPRNHLTVRCSVDDCKTWSSGVEIERFAGYSDVAVSPDGKWVFCFYEKRTLKGNDFFIKGLYLAKIDINNFRKRGLNNE